MKFKITEMTTLDMKVEYDDGTWASIPSSVGEDKTYYLTMIQRYQPKPTTEVSLTDHPMKIGDEGTVGEGVPEGDSAPSEYDYGAARGVCYPTIGLQFDALYHARNGDSSKQTAIDAHIAMVKAKFPNDSTMYSLSALDTALSELKADSKWVDD